MGGLERAPQAPRGARGAPAKPWRPSKYRFVHGLYADIGVDADAESPRDVVALGDLAYWPRGQAFCIFFGRTPVSRGDEIRAARGVNVIGRVMGDATVVKRVQAGSTIRLERASEGGAKR